MADLSKWDGADTVSGVVMGAIGGMVSMLGWFSGKVGKVHARIDALHDRLNDDYITKSEHAATSRAHDQRLERIEGSIDGIDKKTDRTMEILLDLNQRK